jgi:Leucine-rich repeat (LRR) protein
LFFDRWLDDNELTGTLPDMSKLVNLKIMHLENNQLSGSLPPYLAHLPNLQELSIENNSFKGKIPSALLKGKVLFK